MGIMGKAGGHVGHSCQSGTVCALIPILVHFHITERETLMIAIQYHASPALEAFILASAPKHYATPAAPSTLDDILAALALNDPRGFPVFDGGCDHTIYSSPAVNHAFRAWHDSIHAARGLGFTTMGEHCVAQYHWRLAVEAGLPMGDVFALWADSWGQVAYANQHHGKFPADQSAFVAACFHFGIDYAATLTF